MKTAKADFMLFLVFAVLLALFAGQALHSANASQNDYVISDDSGAAVLADMTSAFQALAGHNLGTTAPSTKYQGMTWLDTNATPWTLKRWDGADWIIEAKIDPANNIHIPYIGAYAANADHFRNRLGNGDMFVDQAKITHASGAAQTFTAGAVYNHAVDLWQAKCTGGNITGQQVSAPSGALYRNAYRFTGGAGCTGVYFIQRIPGEDVADLVNLPAKLQVNLCSSGSLMVTWKAYSADASNNFSAVTQFATGTFVTTASQQIFTADLTMPANAYNGVQIEFSIGTFAAGTWTITGAQIESGSHPSLFELLPPERAILRCQRQYVVIDECAQVPTPAGYTIVPIPFPTTMRATPGAVIPITAGTISNASIVTEGAVSARGCNFGILSGSSIGGYIIGRVVAYSALL